MEKRNLLAADHLVAVVLGGQDAQTGLNDATTQTQHQVEGGLCNTHTQFTPMQVGHTHTHTHSSHHRRSVGQGSHSIFTPKFTNFLRTFMRQIKTKTRSNSYTGGSYNLFWNKIAFKIIKGQKPCCDWKNYFPCRKMAALAF